MTHHPSRSARAFAPLLTLACLAASGMTFASPSSADGGLFLANGNFDAPLPPPVDGIPLKYQYRAPVGWNNLSAECTGFGGACGSVSFVTQAVVDSPTPYGVQGEGLVLALYNEAALSQTFTVGAGQAGHYALNWQDAIAASTNPLYQAGLPVQNNPYRILLDGVKVADRRAASSTFTLQGTEVDLTEGQHVLRIEGVVRPDTRNFGSFNQYTVLANTNVALLDKVRISAVPENGTLPMSALGLAGLGLLARRRRRAMSL